MNLIDTAPARALAVYAHPDDADVSCGGTLARWSSAGTEVHVLICTRGEKGSLDARTDPEELATQREKELRSSANVLGVASARVLNHGDGELENDLELRREIVGSIRGVRPEIVIAPDPTALFFGSTYVNHRDHRVTGWATLDAVAPASASPLYFRDAGDPHRVGELWLSGSLEADAAVDIGGTVDMKAEALLCHESQLGDAGEWLRSVVRQRAEEAGNRAGVRYAEEFRRLVF